MKTILMAIKPRHAADMYAGRKTIEFRRVIPRCIQPGNEVSVKALLYESAPTGAVTGECVLNVSSFSPEGIFDDETLKKGCITGDEMRGYFLGRPGYALSVRDVRKYEKPRALRDVLPAGKARAPQNFVYLARDGEGMDDEQ